MNQQPSEPLARTCSVCMGEPEAVGPLNASGVCGYCSPIYYREHKPPTQQRLTGLTFDGEMSFEEGEG